MFGLITFVDHEDCSCYLGLAHVKFVWNAMWDKPSLSGRVGLREVTLPFAEQDWETIRAVFVSTVSPAPSSYSHSILCTSLHDPHQFHGYFFTVCLFK